MEKADWRSLGRDEVGALRGVLSQLCRIAAHKSDVWGDVFVNARSTYGARRLTLNTGTIMSTTLAPLGRARPDQSRGTWRRRM